MNYPRNNYTEDIGLTDFESEGTDNPKDYADLRSLGTPMRPFASPDFGTVFYMLAFDDSDELSRSLLTSYLPGIVTAAIARFPRQLIICHLLFQYIMPVILIVRRTILI